MKKQRIAGTPLEVSRIALGFRSYGGGPRQAVDAVREAIEQGINFFDHADVYRGGKSEEDFSAVWKEMPGLRDDVVVQSKCGLRQAGSPEPSTTKRYDLSYEHIMQSVDGILRRLQVDWIDILLLHRPDPLIEPEQVARAFDKLEQSGKVRHFGVSNHTRFQIELLRNCVRQPLVVNQLELSLLHFPLIEAGILTNRKLDAAFQVDGTLEYCQLTNITIQTWRSLAQGILSGGATDSLSERSARVSAAVAAMAAEKRVSPEAILTAWLLRHPAKMQVIIGTTKPERIRGICQADRVEMTREEWYKLFESSRGTVVP